MEVRKGGTDEDSYETIGCVRCCRGERERGKAAGGCCPRETDPEAKNAKRQTMSPRAAVMMRCAEGRRKHPFPCGRFGLEKWICECF